jgi:hypothetical protein
LNITLTTAAGPVLLTWAEGQPVAVEGEPLARVFWHMAVIHGLFGPFGHRIDLDQPVPAADLLCALREKMNQGHFVGMTHDGVEPEIAYPPGYGQPGIYT